MSASAAAPGSSYAYAQKTESAAESSNAEIFPKDEEEVVFMGGD